MRPAQRRRAAWGDLITGFVILLFAAVLFMFLFSQAGRALTAQVVLDGEVVYSCRLDELEEPVRFRVDEAEYSLVLEFSENGVQVAETTCPGEDCRHMGTIATQERQIICLPNRLVVSLQGNDPSYDAIIG